MCLDLCGNLGGYCGANLLLSFLFCSNDLMTYGFFWGVIFGCFFSPAINVFEIKSCDAPALLFVLWIVLAIDLRSFFPSIFCEDCYRILMKSAWNQ